MRTFSVGSESYDKIAFVHLTKTAGGTLKEMVGNEPSFNTIYLYVKPDWEKYDKDQYNVLYGHPGTWLFGKIGKEKNNDGFGSKFGYITFLRHPVLRTISHYYHLRNVDKGLVGDKIRLSADINDFFKNHYHWEFSNYFCKIFSDGSDILSDKDMEKKYFDSLSHLRNNFLFVGFQEYFSLSIKSINELLQCELKLSSNVNVGDYSLGDLDAETLNEIRRLNYFDLLLYNENLSRFMGKFL